MSECCQAFRKNTDPYTKADLGNWPNGKDYAQNVMHVNNNNHHCLNYYDYY